MLLLLLSRFSRARLFTTPWTAAHQAPHPWDFPGKDTGVGRHCLLQCMKLKSESEVAQSCPTLSDPMDCSLPGSSTHGIFQARVLEWGAIAFYTWTLPDGQYQNQIDYILCRQRWRSSIQTEKQDRELTVARFLNSLLPKSDLNL